jgi:hypothetical protein
MKLIYSVLFLLSLVVTNCKEEKCLSEKLYGEWIFINVFNGKLTKIDTLSKNSFVSNYGTPTWSYLKSGRYINNQGDYQTEGRYAVDFKNCIIKTFDDNGSKGDTLTFEVLYLDNWYLMVSPINENISYFYKK